MLMEMEMREGMVGHPMDDQEELHGEDGSVEVRVELKYDVIGLTTILTDQGGLRRV